MPHLCVPVLDGEAHAVLEAGAVRVADAGRVHNAFDNRVRELCPLEVVLNCRLAPATAHPTNETSAGIHRGGVSVLADCVAYGDREGSYHIDSWDTWQVAGRKIVAKGELVKGPVLVVRGVQRLDEGLPCTPTTSRCSVVKLLRLREESDLFSRRSSQILSSDCILTSAHYSAQTGIFNFIGSMAGGVWRVHHAILDMIHIDENCARDDAPEVRAGRFQLPREIRAYTSCVMPGV